MALLADLEPGEVSAITSHALAREWLPSKLCPGRLFPPCPGSPGSSPWPPPPGCLSGALAWLPSALDSASTEVSSIRRSAVTIGIWTFILRGWLCSRSSCPDKAVGGRNRGGSCLSFLLLDLAEGVFIVQVLQGHSPFPPPLLCLTSPLALVSKPSCFSGPLPPPLRSQMPQHPPTTAIRSPLGDGYAHACKHGVFEVNTCKQGVCQAGTASKCLSVGEEMCKIKMVPVDL